MDHHSLSLHDLQHSVSISLIGIRKSLLCLAGEILDTAME